MVLVYFRVVETFGAGLSPSDGVGTACSRAEVLLAQPDLILAALVPRASRAGRPSLLGTACARAGAGWGLAVRQGLDRTGQGAARA